MNEVVLEASDKMLQSRGRVGSMAVPQAQARKESLAETLEAIQRPSQVPTVSHLVVSLTCIMV